MESSIEKRKPQPPRSWDELLGPFAHTTGLDERVRSTSGLIVLKTKEGTEVSPTFQFDRDEHGQTRVNPSIAMAWSLLTALQIDQLGWSGWTEAGRLVQSRPEHDGKSWVDLLKDSAISERDKLPIYAAIVYDAVDQAAMNGVTLVDPRTILPK